MRFRCEVESVVSPAALVASFDEEDEEASFVEPRTPAPELDVEAVQDLHLARAASKLLT